VRVRFYFRRFWISYRFGSIFRLISHLCCRCTGRGGKN
jgi:hypothetical protein